MRVVWKRRSANKQGKAQRSAALAISRLRRNGLLQLLHSGLREGRACGWRTDGGNGGGRPLQAESATQPYAREPSLE